MSKDFIDDILDNLIRKSATEVENEIFDEIKNNFNDDIVFSENHKNKMNDILNKNKTFSAMLYLVISFMAVILCVQI